ncbi:MAG: TonB-dependent receptor [Acidobacteria bacterium]|nr:TonB-dependent receptor [Acidobacteriota bacterium]
MKVCSRSLMLSVFAALALVFSIHAQDLDDVTISGRITDSNGQLIPGAAVTVIQVETGTERTVAADDEGRYRIIELKPGLYRVRSWATGFGIQEKVDLQTISGQNVQLDFRLAPAGINAEATVTSADDDTPAVDITRTVVGGTVTQREIEELPNTNRAALDFVFTLGGVTEEPLSVRDVAEDASATGVSEATGLLEGGLFSLSGGAAYSNNITIDGLDNNDDRQAQERFQPSIDSIAEVQVITNQFSAEYGRASGGRVNIRTRAGSKKFRGRAFLYFRDDNLNANTYNNNRRNISRPPFTEYNPGFTLSGPIPLGYFKDKTFFFTSYEYNNLSDTTLIDTVVPVAQNPNFALPAPTNINNQRRDISNADNPANAFIAPYIVSLNTPSRNHIFTQRIDHNFTDKHGLTFSYQFGRLMNFRQYLGSTRVLEDAIQGRTRDNDAFYVTDNYVINSKAVNQFKFQYSNFKPGFAAENPDDPVVLIRVRDTATLENRSGTLTAGNSTANFASTRREKRYQFQDTLNYVVGAHTLKVGADVQLIESENLALGDATGTFNFDSVADFLASRVIRFRQNFGTNSVQDNTYYGLFLQDEWRFNRRLTISAGLRYERETIVDDKNNFGPRVGLAYSPFGDNKTVVRLGAGIFYNRALLRTLDDYALGEQQQSFDSRNLAGPSFDDQCFTVPANANAPRCVFLRQLSTSFPSVPSFETLSALNGFSTASTFTRRLDPDLKIPESYQFNVGFERELGSAIVFEANFTYNKTVRLWRETNVNAFILPSGFATYTDFLLAVNSGAFRFELGPMNNTNDLGLGPISQPGRKQ